MTYDPYSLCSKVDARKGEFEADPGVFMPATIQRMQDVLTGEDPSEIVEPGWLSRPDREPTANRFMQQAESFTAEDWTLQTARRAHVLDLAEAWFKRALVLRAKRGIKLHISRNPQYRR